MIFASQSETHSGQECNLFHAFAMSHKGKATSNVSYNLEDGVEAYSNPTAFTRLTEYTEMAKTVHGADFDPAAHDLDPEVVMRVGGGKKHGRYWLGDGAIDSTSAPTLNQLRAQSTDGTPAVRPRPTVASQMVNELQVFPFIIRCLMIFAKPAIV